MVRIPTHREPTHPGEMLLEEFLTPMGMTQRELADAIHVPYQRINEIINRRRGITPGTALRLARFFRMTPGFWMNLQLRWDLYKAQEKGKVNLRNHSTIYNFGKRIERCPASHLISSCLRQDTWF